MLKDDSVFQGLLNEKSLSYTSSAIYGNEFRPVTSVESFQLFQLLFSANNCTHKRLYYAKICRKDTKMFCFGKI